ncbi:hypothetical protein DFH11DRAFT_367251 [Phellopilus nigrolimitatus]|nr:hypothetical protein DFH11DRAFT_367251 [Phellopilus nigrolimitatus]
MALFLDDFGRKLPTTDYLMGAQIGDIAMMEAALAHPSVGLETLEPMMGYTALHSAAEASRARSAAAVRWLLARGIPWNAIDGRGRLAQEVAEEEENGEAVEVLRAWAVRHEYNLFNTTRRPEDDPYYTKPFYQTRIDGVHANAAFCYTDVQYSDLPPSSCGASKGGRPEVAMICEPEGQGVMMEWERPISESLLRQ